MHSVKEMKGDSPFAGFLRGADAGVVTSTEKAVSYTNCK